MSNDSHRPHDTALAVQFALSALRRSLAAVGVFDSEAGDEVHGLLTLMDGATGRLADQTDPAFVSIVPRSRGLPQDRISFVRRACLGPPQRLRLIYSRGDRPSDR